MRARFGLLVWLIGLLFPLAWLGNFSTSYRRGFDAVFGPEWVHIVMHTALFAGLSILLAIVLDLRLHRWGVLIVLSLTLGVAILQESIQLFSQGAAFSQAKALSRAIFDLGIDLLGSLLGLGALYLFRFKRSSQVY